MKKTKLFTGIFSLIFSVFILSACTLNMTQNTTDQIALDSAKEEVAPTPTPTLVPQTEELAKELTATLKTSKGDIVLALFPQVAPQTVKNFTDKAESAYYEGLTFHRVEDWVVQGGDPLGNGTGGGEQATELSQTPFKEGSLGVARGGDIKVSNDSQFFVCIADCSWLTGQYTNFGEVTEGLDIAKSMEIGDKIISISIDSIEPQTLGEKVEVEKVEPTVLEEKPILYYGETCPHCHTVLDYLDKEGRRDELIIKESWENEANNAELLEKAEECGEDPQRVGVPFLFAEGKCLIGAPPIIDYLETI